MNSSIEVAEIKILQGPSYWSVENPLLILMKLKWIEIDDFIKNNLINCVTNKFPRMTCVEDKRPVEIIACVALELQNMAGMRSHFETNKVENNHYYISFEYTIKKAGVYAGEAAIRILNSFLNQEDYDIQKDINELKKIKKNYGIGPTTSYILNEVKKRQIPIYHYSAGSLVTLGYGCNQKKLRTAVADTTSGLGIEIAGDKEETKQILAKANVPVPSGIIVYSEAELKARLKEVNFPLVVKPLDGNQGRGVTTHIYDLDRALFGFNIAKKISDEVIVEEFVPGDDHRFLVVNYKLVAIAKRSPAMVIGNGKSTIQELINETNKDPQRGDSEEHILAQIKIDAVTAKILSENGLTLESIPEKEKIIVLKDTANISAGGTATDLTDHVHPHNKFMVERIAKLFSLDICGVDIVATAVDVPITREIGAVIEVNAGPGIRMHSNPQVGKARNVAANIVDLLFPENKKVTIPIVAVFECNISLLTTQLLERITNLSNMRVGLSNSENICSNSYQLKKANATDYGSMQEVLLDPMINIAILECTHDTMINYGLPFHFCDISILFNDDSSNPSFPLNTVNDILQSKRNLITNTMKTGYSIIDADNNNALLQMVKNTKCSLGLFSLHKDNEIILQHKKEGGLVAFIENNSIVIYKGEWRTKICKIDSLQFGNTDNNSILKVLLATILAAISKEISIELIKEAIINFEFKNKTALQLNE